MGKRLKTADDEALEAGKSDRADGRKGEPESAVIDLAESGSARETDARVEADTSVSRSEVCDFVSVQQRLSFPARLILVSYRQDVEACRRRQSVKGTPRRVLLSQLLWMR